MRIGATSRLLAVLGDPVAHSLSPTMQNAAISALGLDAVYVAIRVGGPGVAHLIRAFETVGVAGNVTVPHKLDVARLLIRLTPIASELEAVNTFWPEGERLVGDNTDVQGVLDAVDALEADGPWLLAGTGGAARAAAAAARKRDVFLLVRSREPVRARRFVAWARELGVAGVAVDDGRAVGVAINATPLGLRPDDDEPIPADRLEPGTAALDLVYAPGLTPWIRACRDRGLRAADGRTMLVAQGARAFERFFPDQTAPRAVMAAAVERALKG
ncbi:MAG: shikimate dehydrogenase [Gemmatimonadota bacterium]|nr:MAG: shikimate dehydrogenase [Gemmatimonadota bacterium]